MHYFGLLAFIILLLYSSLPSEVKKIKRQIKSVKKYQGLRKKGEFSMSKMLDDLKGQNCILKFDDYLGVGTNTIKCNVMEVDEEWIKFSVDSKKGENVIKIVRIEKIIEVEIVT